jgi:hypothetical protein
LDEQKKDQTQSNQIKIIFALQMNVSISCRNSQLEINLAVTLAEVCLSSSYTFKTAVRIGAQNTCS